MLDGIGELPAGWEVVRLGTFSGGKSLTVNPAGKPDAEFILYSVPAHATGKPECCKGRAIGSNKISVTPGTVLLCKINPRINRVWVVADPGEAGHDLIASTEWITFPPHTALVPEYLRFFLMREPVRAYLAASASGVGGSLMRSNAGVAGAIGLPLAPLAEQQRIAAAIQACFNELDEAEAALARARAGLAEYRASLLHAACTGQLTTAWRASHPDPAEDGPALLRRILAERRAAWERAELARLHIHGKPPPIGERWKARYPEPAVPNMKGLPELPSGWTWASLPQLGEFGRGKSKHRPRNDQRLYGAAIPFIQTGEVSQCDGHVRTFSRSYSPFGIAQSKIWPKGTVCITIAANIAASGILDFDACFPDSVVGLVAHDPLMAEYVELFIRTCRSSLEMYAPATAQKNINLDILERVVVPLPPLEEQAEIVRLVDNGLATEANLSELSEAATLRQSILHAAFTGRLVPQDPADEPAAALLARLRDAPAAPRRARAKTPAEAPA